MSTLLTGLVSFLNLNGNSTDQGGTNNGTDTAITYGAITGSLGAAATGNGSTSKIDLGTANLNLTGAMSIAIRVNPTAGPSGFTFLVCRLTGGGGGSNTYEFRLNSLKIEFGTAGSTHQSTATLVAGTWYDLLVTRDASNVVKIYIDGVLDSSGTVSAATSLPSKSTLIGTRDDGFTHFDSTFEAIGIWSRDLTIAEAVELDNSGTGIYYPFTPPPPPPPVVDYFLRLNGIVVPVSITTSPGLVPETIGKMRRSANGTANASRRLIKGGWKFTTAIRTAAEALAFRELLAGEGHVLSFDNQNFYTSQGMAPAAIGSGWAFSASGPKYGSHCATSTTHNSSWAFFEPASPFSLGWWLWETSLWNHYFYRSDGAGWVNGVDGFAIGDMHGLVTVTAGVANFGVGSGTSKWDNIVALPYLVPDAWPGQIYGFGSAFGLLPALTADGLLIEQNTQVSVLGGDAPTGKVSYAKVARNMHDFNFDLAEV